MAGLLDARDLHARLRTHRVGRTLFVLDEVDSTNRWVLDRPAGESIDGIVVAAERQTSGRGRQGRSWECPKGAGLLFTLGLDDRKGGPPSALLPLLVPLAVCNALDEATEIHAEIKWPNDIVVGGRKLGGILIETRATPAGVRTAIGIGINCLQQAGHFASGLRARATSLEILSRHPIDRSRVLVAMLEALDRILTTSAAAEEVCTAWRRRAVGLGGRVQLCHDGRTFSGNLLDVDPSAAILVQLDEGGRRLFDAARTHLLEWSA
jgi:BirA family biotin operon repressor/biotin-[acetyl-CoA-carboxylase] ligase